VALVAVAALAVVVGDAAVGAASHSSKPVTAAIAGGIIGAAAALALLAYRKRRRRRLWEVATELALSFGTAVLVEVLTRSELVFVESLLLGFVAVGAFGSANRIRNRARLPDHGNAGGERDAN